MKRTHTNHQPYVYRSYTSFRQPAHESSRRRHPFSPKLIALVVLVVVSGGAVTYALAHSPKKPTTTTAVSISGKQPTLRQPSSQVAAKSSTDYCTGNTLSQLVLVSISKQHLWACNGVTTVYDSAVVTGMEQYAADLTPPGTYHIYAKQTNQDLKGCDSTGCWDDPVSYWMPWLSNQYGIYGFHDATWRKPSQFGNVDIYAPETAAVVGSHGCVELPLATAKWIYDWSHVGTTVKVVS